MHTLLLHAKRSETQICRSTSQGVVGMQVDLGDLLSCAQAALQGAAGAVLTPSLPELASRLEQQPQAASSAAYYDSFVAGTLFHGVFMSQMGARGTNGWVPAYRASP